jgi:hypothetical protein
MCMRRVRGSSRSYRGDWMTEVVVIGLAAFRLTSLFVHEDGPFAVFQRIRTAAGVPEGAGEIPAGPALVLSCFYCASLWCALLAWGLWRLEPAIPLILGASAVAMIVSDIMGE